MALLLAPNTRVETAANVVISGGKVRVYNANTTTLTSLFSDSALTVPLSNPVIASSGGWPTTNGSTPTLVWSAAGYYDVAFLDASGVAVVSFEDVPALGPDVSSALPDLTGNAGKFLYTDSLTVAWRALSTTDVSDFSTSILNSPDLFFLEAF